VRQAPLPTSPLSQSRRTARSLIRQATPLAEEPSFAVVAGKALTEYDSAMAKIAELQGLRASYGRLALVEANIEVAEMTLRARQVCACSARTHSS
jgi:hypothetical protein